MELLRDSRDAGLLIVLGASNVTRSLADVLASAWEMAEVPPARVLVAAGNGRSYGLRSRVLGRSLPSILESGLWASIEEATAVGDSVGDRGSRTRVLMTDVGNDLIYGQPPRRVARWVENCLLRLPDDSEVVLTLPPMRRLRELTEVGFESLRTLMFPRHDMDYETARCWASELCSELRLLARQAPPHLRSVRLVEPEREWYGLDPIHIRSRARLEAWLTVLGELYPTPGSLPKAARRTMQERLNLLVCRSEECRLVGFEIGRPQPAASFRGTPVGFY